MKMRILNVKAKAKIVASGGIRKSTQKAIRTAAEQDVDRQVEVLLKKFKFDGNKGPHSNDCRDFLDSILDLGFKKTEGKEGEKKTAQWTSPQSRYEFRVYIDHPTPKSATGELLDRVYAYRKQ